jgi:catechol 2,3-dioxygenase-like lactoylglutathione lyase family enzyme
MEREIAELVDGFERGHLTRRDLIRSLTLLAGVGGQSRGQNGRPSAPAFEATGINHISYSVTDYARTRDFYVGLLGARVANDVPGRAQCELHVGGSYILPRTARGGRKPPVVDHVAVSVKDWDKTRIEATLRQRGLRFRPDLNIPNESVHLTDPDGYDLQLVNEKVTSSI